MFKLPLYYKKDVKTLLSDDIIEHYLDTDLTKYENLKAILDRALTILKDDTYSLCFIIKHLLENNYRLNEEVL